MSNKNDALNMLRKTMFRMFKANTLPDLYMEDFTCMWKGLAEHWGIYLSDEDWDLFAEEINCVASDREKIFNELFEKYFENKND